MKKQEEKYREELEEVKHHLNVDVAHIGKIISLSKLVRRWPSRENKRCTRRDQCPSTQDWRCIIFIKHHSPLIFFTL